MQEEGEGEIKKDKSRKKNKETKEKRNKSKKSTIRESKNRKEIMQCEGIISTKKKEKIKQREIEKIKKG